MPLNLDVIVQQTLSKFWDSLLGFLPALILTVVVFIIGWIIAIAVGKLAAEILKRLKFDELFNRTNWDEALAKADLKVDPSAFIGGIVKWALVIVSLQISVELLGWNQFSAFLGKVIGWLPNLIVAALIFVVAVIVADILEKMVRAAVEKSKVGYSHLAGIIVKWSVWIFAVIVILSELGIAADLMKTLFQGLVAVLVISFGLAFGLGGKDVASEMLRDVSKKLKG